MKHLGTQVLHTQRLLLRPFCEEDAAAVYRNWTSDAAVSEFLSWPTHTDISVTQRVVHDWVNAYADPGVYNWAIVCPALGDEPIGVIGVNDPIDETIQLAHIGYCLGRPWWHNGIMSEALAAVMEFLFNEVGVHCVQARHDTRNPHSGGVMQKCGMKRDGILRHCAKNNSGVCDLTYYSLLAEER